MLSYKTYAEYLQLPEFRAVCKTVRERSGGICEICRQREASQPHHVKYCRWGEIDRPENLIDSCYQCHCDAHRCERCSRVCLKAREIKLGLKVCAACRQSG